MTDPILADMQEYHRLPGIFSVKSVMMTIIATSSVGSLQNAVKNCFVTNLSSVMLDPDETYLCSYGPKFSTVSRPPCATGIMGDFDQFSRRIYIRDFMHQTNLDGDDVPAKFRLKNPGWHPMDTDYVPTAGVQEYVCETRAAVLNCVEDSIRLHKIKPPHNLKKRHRDKLRRLQQRTDIVFIDADKGLGIVVLDTDDYRARVIAELQGTYRLQTDADEDPLAATRAELKTELLPRIGNLPRYAQE